MPSSLHSSAHFVIVPFCQLQWSSPSVNFSANACLVLPFWYLLTRVVPDTFQKSSKTVVCCVCSANLYALELVSISVHTRFILPQQWYGILSFFHHLFLSNLKHFPKASWNPSVPVCFQWPLAINPAPLRFLLNDCGAESVVSSLVIDRLVDLLPWESFTTIGDKSAWR